MQACGRIVQLVLRNNALTTLHGIKNLKSLMDLDLSYNIISNFSELEILGSLFLLQNLWLEGNPICCARWYRARVFSFLHNSESVSSHQIALFSHVFFFMFSIIIVSSTVLE